MTAATAGPILAAGWRRIAAVTLGFILAYHATLAAVLVIRFGHLPNYATLYDWPANIARILRSTPSVRDALPIALDEWLLELGYIDPAYGHGIAVWSLAVLPAKLLRGGAHRRPGRRQRGPAARGPLPRRRPLRRRPRQRCRRGARRPGERQRHLGGLLRHAVLGDHAQHAGRRHLGGAPAPAARPLAPGGRARPPAARPRDALAPGGGPPGPALPRLEPETP